MKKILMLIISLCVFALSAQEAFVVYTDGEVEISIDGVWEPLNLGDSVFSSDNLRVGVGALIEFNVNGSRIMISQAGEYDMGKVLSKGVNTSKSGIGDMMLGKVGRLLTEDERDMTTAVGGVRASEAVEVSLDWADDIYLGIDNAKLAIRDGRYELAEESLLFVEGAAYRDEEYAEIYYLLGYTYYLDGDLKNALIYFEKSQPTAMDDYFEDYILNLSSLYISSFSYDKAMELLENTSFSKDYEIQEALFLKGVIYYEENDFDAAADSWEEALEYDGDMNETIESMLSTL